MLAGVLLAAGASRRFGPDDKLLSTFEGRPLVTHAAEALRLVQPDLLVGVVRSGQIADRLSGYHCVTPPETDPKQADSLRAGVAEAKARGATRVLVVLGDMPLVTPDLMQAVVARCTDTQPSAATNGARPMPPACFPAASLDDLLALRGDRGAGALLKGLPPSALVEASAEQLRDVDTPEELAGTASPPRTPAVRPAALSGPKPSG